ncbi:uncharacterized protein LOC144905020 isoform X1 [Branchiostoma floridae x Branchiostoma belcheri]
MTTTCGAYHLEALRRQQVIDRKQLALQRLAQKEAEEQARSAEHAARLERQRRERIEAKHRAQQEHLAALSGGEKRKSHKKDRRSDHLTRQVLSLTPTDQKRLYSVLKEEMSKSAGAKPHAHKNYRTTQDRTAGVHPAVIHDLKKKEKLLRNNNLTMGHWSDYVD